MLNEHDEDGLEQVPEQAEQLEGLAQPGGLDDTQPERASLLERLDEAESRTVEARAHSAELQSRIAEAEARIADAEAAVAEAESRSHAAGRETRTIEERAVDA